MLLKTPGFGNPGFLKKREVPFPLTANLEGRCGHSLAYYSITGLVLADAG